jgi:hypothetical protein
MAPLGASSITAALERFSYNNFNAFALFAQGYNCSIYFTIFENQKLI